MSRTLHHRRSYYYQVRGRKYFVKVYHRATRAKVKVELKNTAVNPELEPEPSRHRHFVLWD